MHTFNSIKHNFPNGGIYIYHYYYLILHKKLVFMQQIAELEATPAGDGIYCCGTMPSTLAVRMVASSKNK